MKQYNIYLRKDGRWEGRLSQGIQDGKRKYKSFFGHSREEVTEKIDAYRTVCFAVNTCDVTVSMLFSQWFQQTILRVKESTAANYLMKANKHILPHFGDYLITDLTAEDIYDFVESKKKSGLSYRYISDIVVLLRAMYKFAVRKYRIVNPLDGIRLTGKKKAEVQLLDASEQQTLEQYLFQNRNLTTLGTALTKVTGLRIGELCALQWADIDLSKRILTVRKTLQRIQCKEGATKTKLVVTEPKSESSQRQIPIPECMVNFLCEFQGSGDQYVLSGTDKPVEPRTMQYRFASILKSANLPSVHFHSLRHCFATDCIRLGFDVKALSELLGHSSVEITLNRYVHSSFDRKREYMDRIRLTA